MRSAGEDGSYKFFERMNLLTPPKFIPQVLVQVVKFDNSKAPKVVGYVTLIP